MNYQRKRVAKRLASGLLAGALALGGLAISGGSVSAKTPLSPSTQRVAGADRYETAVAVARAILGAGVPSDGLVIASGESPYDALAAASLTTNNRPLLLVKKDSIPASVADFLSDFKSSLAAAAAPRVYVIGGESAISASTLTAITSAVTTTGDLTPPTVARVSGADRYATAKAISDVPGNTAATDKLIIVNGEDGKWADALSAGAVSTLKGWPIVVTNSSGLEASAKAKIDSYLALPGSVAEFLIIGGSSVVSSSVEEYLVSQDVWPEDIRRIGGADRYHTSLLVNVWLIDTNTLPLTVTGAKTVTLVSGEAPWDALGAAGWAKKNESHIQLTNTAGGNVFVSTLAGTAATLAHEGIANAGDNLWIIGGKSAVSDAAKLGYVAASAATDGTSALADCVVGADTVTLSMSRALTAAESAAFTADGSDFEIGVKRNNVALAAADVDISVLDVPGVPKRTVYFVDIDATDAGGAKRIQIGDTISWGGIIEGLTVSGFTPDRTTVGASCTATRDLVPPVVTLRALPGTDAGTGTAGSQLYYLTSNEPISITGAIGTLTNVTDAASNAVALVKSAGSAVLGTDEYVLELAATEAAAAGLLALDSLDVVSIARASITDVGGNNPSVDVTATAVADATGAAVTVAGVRCAANAEASFVRNNLTISAKNTGAVDGAVGNSYTMSVVNQRGLLLPKIVVDGTAKTITVTADTGYHDADDVATAAANAGLTGLIGNWVVTSAGAGTFNPTITPVLSVSGTSDCQVLMTTAEPVTAATAGTTVTVNGYGAPFITAGAVVGSQARVAATPALGARWATLVTFTTTTLGNGVITFANGDTGMSDISGNRTLAAITFAAS